VLPGDRREIQIRFPAGATAPAAVKLDGWNVAPRIVTIGAAPTAH
jgi:hypothetical protein